MSKAKKELTDEEKESRWKDQQLATPSPFWCRHGFHKWSKWVFSKIRYHNEKGEYLYDRIQQRRMCTICFFDERVNV